MTPENDIWIFVDIQYLFIYTINIAAFFVDFMLIYTMKYLIIKIIQFIRR